MTFEQVRRLFTYDPHSGVLTWTSATPKAAGKRAGSLRHGYLIVKHAGKTYRAHRLIWTWMTGAPPPSDIDHEDLCRSNNRWQNLRSATSTENKGNCILRGDNTSGFKGVSFVRSSGRWRAYLWTTELGEGGAKKPKQRWLGTFHTKEEASAAYLAAAKEYFGEFARAA